MVRSVNLTCCAVLIMTTFLSAGRAQGQSEDARTWAAATFDRYEVTPNLTYHRAGNYDVKLDVYVPRDITRPNPTLVYFHGSGWVVNSKEALFLSVLPFLVEGWSVVNVGYRLASVARAPAAVEDGRCALRWVLRHAAEYGFDPDRLVLMGHSAGGHLALTTGILPVSAGFDRSCAFGNEPNDMSLGESEVAVAAIINWFGIVDVADLLTGEHARSFAVTWLGSQPDRDKVARAVSPLNFIRPGLPPILTIHGDADPTVPHDQAVRLHALLEDARVPNRLLTIPNGGHAAFSREQNIRAYDAIWAFLKQHGISNY